MSYTRAWNYLFSNSKTTVNQESNPPTHLDDNFVNIDKYQELDDNFVDLKKPEVKPAAPTVTLLNQGLSVDENYVTDKKVIIHYPTANSQFLGDLYDLIPLTKTSAHPMFLGKDADGKSHFIKEVEHDMAFVEAFMGQLYQAFALYGVGRAFERCSAFGDQLKISSQGLTNFKTFKDMHKDEQSTEINLNVHITKEQLGDPLFRRRFLRLLTISFCMGEDDFHSGNLTIASGASPGLQIFDGDCAFWSVTHKIKGPRTLVDYVIRNPETAFDITENKILAFPDIGGYQIIDTIKFEITGPCCYPSVTNPLTTKLKLSNNPWSWEDAELVKSLKNHPDTLPISFEEYMDWMLDISPRFSAMAALNIPSELKVKSTGENVIDLYTQANVKLSNQLEKYLLNIPQFRMFLEDHKETIFKHLLIRMLIRNARLMKEKAEALKLPEKQIFAKQFDNAMVNSEDLVKRFNGVIEKINEARKGGDYLYIPLINNDRAKLKGIITDAELIAKEMIQVENQHGTENWQLFEKFDYQFKPKAADPTLNKAPEKNNKFNLN